MFGEAIPLIITGDGDTDRLVERRTSGNLPVGERKKHRNIQERKKERLNSELLIAIQKSDEKMVESLLKKGANPEACCQDTMCSSVSLAALVGNTEILKQLLESASNESRDNEGRQAVHLACFQGNIEILEILLSKNPKLKNSPVQPNDGVLKSGQKDSWDHNHNEITSLLPNITVGSTPLHVACRWSKTETVDFLLHQHVNVNIKDGQGLTPLDVAGLATDEKQNVYDIAYNLIKWKAEVIEEEEETTDGQSLNTQCVTALHNAVENENIDLIDLLLENGASVTVLNERGESPLHFAVRKKRLEPLRTVISWINIDKIDRKSSEGLTPLHQAVLEEWESGVGVLLEAGADIKITSDPRNETVLHLAARTKNPKILEELLIIENASEIINCRDINGFTSLFRAMEIKFIPNVEILIIYGADLGLKLPGGISIYHYATQCDTVDILKLILKQDIRKTLINVFTGDNGYMSGMTPLHIASYNGSVEAVKLLIREGAKINLKTTSENKAHRFSTALHLAAQKGYSRTIQVILSNKNADLSLKDELGWTPLQIAACNSHGKCTIMMLKHGAIITDRVEYQGSKKSSLDIMVSTLPKCADLLENLFDSCITSDNRGINRADFSIKLDYDILCANGRNHTDRQLSFLENVLNKAVLKEKLMLHPLVESFLYYKWKKIKIFFWILFALYFLHTVSMTFYSYITYVQCEKIWLPLMISTNLFLLLIITTEIFQVFPLKRYYFLDTETWIKWSLICSSIATLCLDPSNEMTRDFACCCVLLAWTEMLFLSARFSVFGLHVLMFEKVVENIFQVLTRFSFLFLGFLFAFMIHFKGKEPFSHIFTGLCKIFIMIVELDYSSELVESDDHVGRIMYVAFFLMIATAMTNLIVGMAVSDIALLENQGRIQRLVKQTGFLSFLELCLNNDFLMGCFPKKFKSYIKNCRKVELQMCVRPNDHVETLPEELRLSLLAKVIQSNTHDDNADITFQNAKFDSIEEKLKNLNDKMNSILTKIESLPKYNK